MTPENCCCSLYQTPPLWLVEEKVRNVTVLREGNISSSLDGAAYKRTCVFKMWFILRMTPWKINNFADTFTVQSAEAFPLEDSGRTGSKCQREAQPPSSSNIKNSPFISDLPAFKFICIWCPLGWCCWKDLEQTPGVNRCISQLMWAVLHQFAAVSPAPRESGSWGYIKGYLHYRNEWQCSFSFLCEYSLVALLTGCIPSTACCEERLKMLQISLIWSVPEYAATTTLWGGHEFLY